MSVVKIKRDIKTLKNELEEIDTTISDPIERNEYRKELEKKLKKLQRTKVQTEQLEKEQQELESLKSEFISNSEDLSQIEESEDDDNEKIEFEIEEKLTPTTSPLSQNITTEPKRSNLAILFSAVYGIIGLLLILFVADSLENRFYIASYEESQTSELIDLKSSSIQSDIAQKNTEDEYLSDSSESESLYTSNNLSEESSEDEYSSNSSELESLYTSDNLSEESSENKYSYNSSNSIRGDRCLF